MLIFKPARIATMILPAVLLLACQGEVEMDKPITPMQENEQATPVDRKTPTTHIPTLVAAPTNTSTPPSPRICSPLAGFQIVELEPLIVNPYQPPPPGMDRPHQGIDLAVLDEDSGIALPGESVQVILSGNVSTVIQDRFPYGNAILVESPLKSVEVQQLPAPWEGVHPDPALTCPATNGQQQEHVSESIYILYAHLLEAPPFTVGTELKCGDVIGKIGMSGNALNPHVHVEARLGPSGAQFESMAHYDSSATPAEMSAYCLWRVNGTFQHFDPMNLLNGPLFSESSSP
jgi:murein DD-endopeptidase MepM/ murein hydrolase activator NlpD